MASLVAVLALPGLVAAHPLGNFTINHYAGIRVEPERILLDVVIDQAEIPAFQARLAFDLDGDGELSDSETASGRVRACDELSSSLDLDAGGQSQTLRLVEAGLTFPPGAAGLSTMRTVCGFEAKLAAPIGANTEITFADRSFAERIGWREIVVEGSGITLTASEGTLRTEGVSDRLTDYPADRLAQAVADTGLSIMATPGGPELLPLDIPDADPLPGMSHGKGPGGVSSATMVPEAAAVVPGGVVASDLPSIFRTADLTPLVLLISILTAAALGAGHALTPGHGKTLMAAYLVGTRGTPAHAAGLGLSVALSHTLGILALAALVVGAQGVLAPDVVVKGAPIVAAISIVAIGGWMLVGEARRRLGAPRAGDGHDHDHGHEHEDEHEDKDAHDHDHRRDHEHDHGHDHEHDHGHDHEHHDSDHVHDGTHRHGGLAHTHVPAPGSTISWRSLFVLGLAGGLIPSASALLILLGAIAAGRPAFGFVLVVAFGLGMALVMGGIGVALVLARGRLDRANGSAALGRVREQLPLLASAVVLGFGVYLTVQALAGTTTL